MGKDLWLKRIHWPITGLGFGTPANLACLSAKQRSRLGPTALTSALVGLMLVVVVLGLDHLLFSGDSLERVRAIGAMPLTSRLEGIVVSSVAEELIYRLGISTLVASLMFLLLRRRSPQAAHISAWLGIVIASVLFGLAHVGNAPNAAHPIVRAVTLNGLSGLVLGWLYWYRGLEAALVAHFVADAIIYLLIASFL